MSLRLRFGPTEEVSELTPTPLKRGRGRPKKDTSPVALDLEIPEPKLYHGDCFEIMAGLPEGSVDLVLNDPPYGCTANDWDTTGYSLEKCWEHYERLLKPNGIVVLFACSDATEDPFLLKVMASRPQGWKLYTLVYEKYQHSNPFLAQYRPLRYHEDIIVFYRGSHHFEPQMWLKKQTTNKNIGLNGDKMMMPRSILPVFPMEKHKIHPTQKPVKTMEWLVQSYCPLGGTILDNTMGSGSTGVACVNTNRAFIGIELDDGYFSKAKDRIILAMRKQLHEELDVTPEKKVRAEDVELPKLQAQFSPVALMKFYNDLQLNLMEYDQVCAVIVSYLNQYFAIIQGKELSYMEWSFMNSGLQIRSPCSPFAEEILGTDEHRCDFVERTHAEQKRKLMKCRMANEEGKLIDMFDMWSRHIDAKEYQNTVFDPTQQQCDDESSLNTFTCSKVLKELRLSRNGVSFTGFERSKVMPILDHIFNLAGGDVLCFEYFLDWLAFPLQTGQKTNVALLVKGQPGCGKGVLFENIMRGLIYGDHLSVQLSGGKQLNQKFNAHWKNKVLVIIDEPNKLNRDQRDNLKNMITSDVTVVHQKYVSEQFEQDYTNYVFTCNHVPAEFLDADDRRFFIVQHNGKHVQDKEYFADLLRIMSPPSAGYVDFYKFLMLRDIKVFKKGEAPPQTHIKDRLACESVDPIFRYLRFLCEESGETFPERLPFMTFLTNAITWVKNEHLKASWLKSGQLELKKVILEFFPDFVLDKATNMGVGHKVARCIYFPPRDELIQMLIDKHLYIKSDELEDEIKTEDMILDDAQEIVDSRSLLEIDVLQDELRMAEEELERMNTIEGERGEDRFDYE